MYNSININYDAITIDRIYTGIVLSIVPKGIATFVMKLS